MYKISVNKEKCSKCQKCTKVCTIGVIKEGIFKIPEVVSEENCFRCGHCVAVCKEKAVIHSEFNYNKLIDKKDINVTDEEMATFLATKRSCRFYKEAPISSEIWKKISETASYGPSAFNCEDRVITVINDKNILIKIQTDILKKLKKDLKLFKLLQKRPFCWIFHESSRNHFKRLCLDFETTLEKCKKGKDGLFHDAPYLVIVSSVGMDPLGKDNSLAASHYLMLQAQAMGIGSAINGFAQSYPKIISKHVKLPFMHKVFSAITMGYPEIDFQRSVKRKEIEFSMI